MATELMTALEPGHYIVGEYLGTDAPRSFEKRDGTGSAESRPRLRLLVGTRVEVIPFTDQAALDATVGQVLEAREILAVPVWINGPYDELTRRSIPSNATFTGRAPRAGE